MTTIFDFNLFINNIVSLFQLRADKQQLSFSVNVPLFTQWVTADKHYFSQIVNTLLDNAFKHTNIGGVTLYISFNNELLLLSVEDTGCGIAEKEIALIFGSFKEIDDANFSELDLGLTISNELIQSLNATISVDSHVNHGSIFSLSIPLHLVSEPPPHLFDSSPKPDKQVPIPSLSRYKNNIIIADDNEINIILLSFMLDELNYTYDTAVNGAEALSLLVSHSYQLALIDLNMPVMNGIELIKLLRKKNISIPIIAISAYADKNNISEALTAGFDDYITKPFDEKKLNLLINTYI